MLAKLFALFSYAWMSVNSFLHEGDPLPTSKTLLFSEKLQLTTSAANIDLLSDDPLTLTCKFVPSDHPTFAELLSLKMFKRSLTGTDTKHLVTLTRKGLKDADDFSGSASGQVFNDVGRESKLVVEYVKPTPAESGVYTCQAVGLDSSDLVVSNQSSVVVDDIKCLDALPRQSLPNIKKSLIECGVAPQDWFQVLRDLTERQYMYLNTSSRVYGVANVFNSKSFYVLTDVFLVPWEAEQICKDNNGYMAEINTEEEYLFINSSLSLIVQGKYAPFSAIVTGMKLDVQKDEFRCIAHSGYPAFVGYWAPDEPDKFQDPSFNYIMLVDHERVGNFLMADGTNMRSSFVANLCEVTNDVDEESTQ